LHRGGLHLFPFFFFGIQVLFLPAVAVLSHWEKAGGRCVHGSKDSKDLKAIGNKKGSTSYGKGGFP
jgi:hypothetical protein